MFWELIVLGGAWFWISFSVFFVWLLFTTSHEKGVQSTTVIVIFLLLLAFFGDFNIFSWIYHHPISTICWSVGYVFAGVIWSIGKWYLFNTKIKTTYNSLRNQFKSRHNIDSPSIPEDKLCEWKHYLADGYNWESVTKYYSLKISRQLQPDIQGLQPVAQEYKDIIVFWMMFWPFSLAFFFLSDFLERLYYRVYEVIVNIFSRVSNFVFKGIVDDFQINSSQKSMADAVEKGVSDVLEGKCVVVNPGDKFPGDRDET